MIVYALYYERNTLTEFNTYQPSASIGQSWGLYVSEEAAKQEAKTLAGGLSLEWQREEQRIIAVFRPGSEYGGRFTISPQQVKGSQA